MDIPRNQFGFPDTDERVPSHTSDEIHAEILALRILRDEFTVRTRGAEAALSLALSKG